MVQDGSNELFTAQVYFWATFSLILQSTSPQILYTELPLKGQEGILKAMIKHGAMDKVICNSLQWGKPLDTYRS